METFKDAPLHPAREDTPLDEVLRERAAIRARVGNDRRRPLPADSYAGSFPAGNLVERSSCRPGSVGK
jgi:hypothetical protein